MISKDAKKTGKIIFLTTVFLWLPHLFSQKLPPLYYGIKFYCLDHSTIEFVTMPWKNGHQYI
jgi:hypothetical protein